MPDMPTLLRCPECPQLFEVSEEDPDATLTDILHHLTGLRHNHLHRTAMALLAKVEEVR